MFQLQQEIYDNNKEIPSPAEVLAHANVDSALQQLGTEQSSENPNTSDVTTLSEVSACVWTVKADIVEIRKLLEAQSDTSQQILKNILDVLQKRGILELPTSECLRHSAIQKDEIAERWEFSGKFADSGQSLDAVKQDSNTDTYIACNVQFPCDATECVTGAEPCIGNCACGGNFTSDDGTVICNSCGNLQQENFLDQVVDAPKKVSRIRRSSSTNVESLHFDHISDFTAFQTPSSLARSNTKARSVTMERPGRVALIAESRLFEFFSAFIIIAHSVFIGAWVEYKSAVNMQGHFAFTVGNILLTICFLGEIVVKFVAEGRQYFSGHERGWNAFDLCLLSLVFIEVGVGFAVRGEAKEGAKKVLKIAEMVRAARVLRIFRVLKFSSTLTTILTQIINTMACLGWILVMSFMMIFTMAVCFTMGSLSLVNPDVDDATIDMALHFNDVYHHFGTVHASLFTIAAAVSGGYQWADVVSAMHQMGWLYQALFVLFVGFFAIAVLNIITGIFVDNALEADHEMTSEKERKKEQARSTRLRFIFDCMDEDNKGFITSDDFVGMKNDPDMVTLMNELKIPQADAGNLFKLLDFNENGELDIHEFVSGLLRLKSNSTSLDLQTLLYEGRKSKVLLTEGAAFSRRSFREIDERLRGIEDRLASTNA